MNFLEKMRGRNNYSYGIVYRYIWNRFSVLASVLWSALSGGAGAESFFYGRIWAGDICRGVSSPALAAVVCICHAGDSRGHGSNDSAWEWLYVHYCLPLSHQSGGSRGVLDNFFSHGILKRLNCSYRVGIFSILTSVRDLPDEKQN